MSTIYIQVVEIKELVKHPNADNLEIAKVLGTQVVVHKQSAHFKSRLCAYFPPDILIPPETAEKFGVTKYLKHAYYPGIEEKVQCRVSASRLRGVESYGFLSALPEGSFALGQNLNEMFGGVKYEPPLSLFSGDCLAPLVGFPKYTDIENYYAYPNAFKEGEEIYIFEKVDGCNFRVGIIDGELVVGSHNNRIVIGDNLYNIPLKLYPQIEEFLRSYNEDVVLFGEILGVQSLDYGVDPNTKDFAAFDLWADGEYLDLGDWIYSASLAGIPVVPSLYKGPFSADVINGYTNGPSMYPNIRHKFKGREGIVFRPVKERYSDVLNGRLILKSISADFREHD